jgi:hypothetical protein
VGRELEQVLVQEDDVGRLAHLDAAALLVQEPRISRA